MKEVEEKVDDYEEFQSIPTLPSFGSNFLFDLENKKIIFNGDAQHKEQIAKGHSKVRVNGGVIAGKLVGSSPCVTPER